MKERYFPLAVKFIPKENILFEKVVDVSKIEVEQTYPVSFESIPPLIKGNEYSIRILSGIDGGEVFTYAKDVNRKGCQLLVNVRQFQMRGSRK